MAIPEKVGHDRRGNPIFKKTKEGELEITSEGKPIIDDDLPQVIEKFTDWIKRKGIV